MFCEQGSFRPTFDFKLCIDTGNSPPVCCRQPFYVIHEKTIMNNNIQALEEHYRICHCVCSWVSLFILATTPFQEGCTNTHDSIWRLYMSYRPLNSVTCSFDFHIPCCANIIKHFDKSYDRISFISLDIRSSYHQIRVHWSDQEKLVFSRRLEKK